MVFKKLRQAMGIGGPQVETTLQNPNTQPGGVVRGEITLIGGEHDSNIKSLNLALRSRVEVESLDLGTHRDRGEIVGAHPGQCPAGAAEWGADGVVDE